MKDDEIVRDVRESLVGFPSQRENRLEEKSYSVDVDSDHCEADHAVHDSGSGDLPELKERRSFQNLLDWVIVGIRWVSDEAKSSGSERFPSGSNELSEKEHVQRSTEPQSEHSGERDPVT